MSSIVVSELDFAHPGAEPLFFDVSFGVSPGEHAAIVGPNGVGKSTILSILAGDLETDGGEFTIGGTWLRMTQDVGMGNPDDSLRQMLLTVAEPPQRAAGEALIAAEEALAEGTDDGTAYAEALTEWGDRGGYELEVAWASAAERSLKTPVDDFSTRKVGELSGGERKRLVLDLLLSSGADVLLLDEPDNYLDIPTRVWLEEQILQTSTTILMVSHDRALLERCTTKIIVVEGSGCWVHGGSYATFPEAREARQARLGDALQRWNEEERRLFRHMKIMKQRAAANFKNATKANAAETRWEKFVAAGPPPPPVPDQQSKVGLRGADSARRVLNLVDVGIDDLFFPFTDEVHFGERVGLIGPNGTGKTHLLREAHRAGHEVSPSVTRHIVPPRVTSQRTCDTGERTADGRPLALDDGVLRSDPECRDLVSAFGARWSGIRHAADDGASGVRVRTERRRIQRIHRLEHHSRPLFHLTQPGGSAALSGT